MNRYPRRANQIIPSFIPHDLVSVNNGNRGETSDMVKDHLNSQYGRQLAGLGRADYAGDDDFQDGQLDELEGQDDVVGSGIFDEAGDNATVHKDMGVFQDHPNLPGYIAREVQFEPNEDIESLPAGAQVVSVPAGGMTWGGRLESPGACAPAQPYRKGSQIAPPPSGIVPVKSSAPPAVMMQPARVAPVATTTVGALMPRGPRPMPQPTWQQAQRPVPPPAWGWKPVELAGANRWAPVPANASRTCAPCAAKPPSAPARGISGLGENQGESPMLAYIAGGALVGVAVALVWGTLGINAPKTAKR